MSKDKKKKKEDKDKAEKQDKKQDKKQCKKQDGRRLCKWDKDDIEKKLDKLKEMVVPARFICRRCGRVAAKSDSLCKPVEL